MNNYPYESLSPLGRFQIIENSQMVDRKETEVSRPWKERLFSLPFKPFKKTKIIVTYIPKSEILQYGNVIVCHPAIAAKIRQELQK